jgi:hypothetical protein
MVDFPVPAGPSIATVIAVFLYYVLPYPPLSLPESETRILLSG